MGRTKTGGSSRRPTLERLEPRLLLDGLTDLGPVGPPEAPAAPPADQPADFVDPRQLGPSTRRTGLIISEIMYHPPEPHAADLEFVELTNTEPVPQDISRFRLSGEADFEFPEGTVIGGLERLVVAADPSAVEAFYGITGVLGPLPNRLSNGGGVVRLSNRMGAILLEVEYSDAYPWPAEADGAGPSLVLVRPDYGEDNVEAWDASARLYGNPGQSNPTVDDSLASVVVNEVLAHTDLPQTDFVELYNHSTQSVDIAGCVLSEHPDPGISGFVVPPGTMLGPRGFVSFDQGELGFSLSMHGDTVYLFSPAGDRVIDAVRFGAQANGVSLGRVGDGGPEIRVLSGLSPGEPNDAPAGHDIVINEIMYHPISEDTDDEYVELFNRGGSEVVLDHWRFTQGIRYTFPADTVISAGGYLVVAKDAARLIAAHPGTLSAANTVGDYSGNLSDRGERIVLAKPDDPDLPDEDFVVVDEVWYRDGESWGEWSDGDGSSLELIDPYSDNMRAMNWADSDETAKAPWTLVEYTGVLDHGRNAANEIQILLEGQGECLLDNVVVFRQGEGNRVANGTFESGLGGWVIQGTHIDSHLETSEGYQSSRSLHLVASRRGDNSANRVETDLSSSLAGGQTATIRARVRWLRGCPGILLRLHGNWLEAPGEMEVPADLGTPGAPNSRYAANAGPAIYDVTHRPVTPAAYQSVVVTARVADVDGLSSVRLKYRNDTDSPSVVRTVTMNDSGTGGDAVAEDGIWSATIPGHAANKLVAFHVEATDVHAQAVTNRFPSSAPGEECHVMFGQAERTGTFGTYRFWMTEADRAQWASRQKQSDHPVHGTFVYGDFRAIYNAGARFRGSPFVRSAGDPETKDTSYVFYAPKDSRLLGSTSLNLDRLEGDDTRQRERMSLWLADQTDTPFFYQRYVHLFVNERHKGTIYGDSQQPNDDYVDYWWPEGRGGELFKIDDWFEFNDNSQVSKEFNDNGQLRLYETTGGEKKKARYRWSWRKEPVTGWDDDYTSFFELVDAMNLSYTSPQYAALAPALVDYEEWMHVFAVRHIIRDWDSYGYNRGKNMSMYKPLDGPWEMIMWDLDHSHLTGSPTDNNLFSINCPTMKYQFFRYPTFLRAYWRAISETANGPMRAEVCNPLMDANYAAFQANGISVTSPDSGLKQWIANRRTWLLGQLNGVAANFEITTNGGNDLSTDQQVLTLSGTAPVEAKTICINGSPAPVTFTSVTGWTVEIGLSPGDNVLTVEGFDSRGELVASDTITATFTDSGSSPIGLLVINEIMYHPDDSDAEFIEIHNASDTQAFDLSGWRLDGVGYTFVPGSILRAGEYVVLAENATAFASAYGAGALAAVVGEYGENGALSNGGETLRLLMPAAGDRWAPVDEVLYDDALPWPLQADGDGPSLQLMDRSKDNNWIGNWAVDDADPATPGEANSVARVLPATPQIRINELQGDNAATLADNAGDFDPWIELLNAGGENVLAVEVHQADPDGGDLAMELSLTFSEPDGSEDVTLIESGSEWRYLDDGSDQGTAWRAASFDDDEWLSGPARLGYGDAVETLLDDGGVPTDRHITYYFRRTFGVTEPSSFTAADLRAQRDDGIVVYLNGEEIWRDNMPSGDIDYETTSLTYVDGDDETTWVDAAPVPVGLLEEGPNVLAVEVHQYAATDSDVGFDLELIGHRTIHGAVTEIVAPDATWTYSDDGSDQGTEWRKCDFDDGAWSGGPAALGFGGDGETTGLQAGHITYYFRHTIAMQQASASNPLLRIRGDDGAVVYLNDQEVLRVNMPDGEVDAATRALAPVEGDDEAEVTETALDPDLFVTGAGLDNLQDCYLTDDYTDLTKWGFPAGASLAGGEYLLVWADGETGEQTPGNLHASFAMDALPGSLALVWLLDGTPIVVDYVDYDFTPADRSSGRWPNGEGDAYPMVSPTPRQPNSGPYVGAVVVSEIHYNPEDSDDLEFIELYNRSGAPVDLWETFDSQDYSWQLEGFGFPADTTLAAGETLVVVPFDPVAEPDELAAFEARYGLGDPGVQIVGGYGAHLDNGGEALRLRRPALPAGGEPGSIQYLLIDEVRYDDDRPWPTGADGGGASLQRISSSVWGDDAGSWEALVPTPGVFGLMANIVDVSPDPRRSPVAEIAIVFNEAVTGFDVGDLSLTRDDGANLLTDQPLTTSDGITWALGGLADLTAADGAYALQLAKAGSGIADVGGNPLYGDAAEAWVVDTAGPTADVVDVSPDPNDMPVEQIEIVFDEPVTGLDVGDLTLTRGGGGNLLTGSEDLETADGITWILAGLGALTGMEGTHTMTLTLAAAGSGIADLAGNPLTASASDTWVSAIPDRNPPTATISDVSPSPRNSAVRQVQILFSEPVVGLDVGDLALRRDGGDDLLTGGESLHTSDAIAWTLAGLDAATGAAGGTYVLTLTASASGITDAVGNPLASSASVSWVTDLDRPTADIIDVAPDPRDLAVEQIDIVFSEAVTGLDVGDLSLTRVGAGELLTGDEPLTTTDHVTWTLSGLRALTSTASVAGFVAFNDQVRNAGTHANTTTYAANGTSSGFLRDVATGDATPVRLTLTASGIHYASGAANPATGTDAHEIFGGSVDFSWSSGASIEIQASNNDYYTHTFSNLDAEGASTYSFHGTAVRGSIDYTDRWTLVTLEGAVSYTADHSSGVGVVTAAVNPALEANQVAIWTGHNSAAGQGFVAGWTDIDPGPDGVIAVRSQQYKGPTPNVGSGNSSSGSKGYALAGIRLEESVPSGVRGTYRLELSAAGSRVRDVAGNAFPLDAADNWTIGADVPPAVMDVRRNVDSAPATELTSVAIEFSQDVSSSLSAEDLTVHNGTADRDVSLAGVTMVYDPSTDRAEWDLSPLDLETGHYTLSLASYEVAGPTGLALDGDADGDEGGDWSASLVVTIAGDVDADGTVGRADFLSVLDHFGQRGAGWSGGDLNADAVVDFRDYMILKRSFGSSVPVSPPAAMEATPSAEAETSAAEAALPAPTAPTPAPGETGDVGVAVAWHDTTSQEPPAPSPVTSGDAASGAAEVTPAAQPTPSPSVNPLATPLEPVDVLAAGGEGSAEGDGTADAASLAPSLLDVLDTPPLATPLTDAPM